MTDLDSTASDRPTDPGPTTPPVDSIVELAVEPAAGPVAGEPPPPTAFAWTPDLASGHVPEAGSEASSELAAPPRRRWRPMDTVVWVAGLTVAAGIAVASVNVVAQTSPPSAFEGGRRFGEIVGDVIGVVLGALAIWAPIVWLSRRRGGQRRLLAPVVPVLAIVLMFASFATVLSRSAEAAAAFAAAPLRLTLADVLRIDPPYRLDRFPADQERQIADSFRQGDPNAFKTLDIRTIYDGEELSGWMLVADADVRPGSEAITMAGVELGFTGEGIARHHVRLGSRDAIVVSADGSGLVVWVESPFILMTFAETENGARRLSEAVVLD